MKDQKKKRKEIVVLSDGATTRSVCCIAMTIPYRY